MPKNAIISQRVEEKKSGKWKSSNSLHKSSVYLRISDFESFRASAAESSGLVTFFASKSTCFTTKLKFSCQRVEDFFRFLDFMQFRDKQYMTFRPHKLSSCNCSKQTVWGSCPRSIFGCRNRTIPFA